MEKITLHLAAAERKLLCSGVVPPLGYVKRIQSTTPGTDVQFTLDELDDLTGWIAAEANHCKSKRRQQALDGILRKIERLLAPEQGSQPRLRLHDPDRPPTPVPDEMAGEMENMLTEMEFMATSLGIDIEEMIGHVMPTQIAPDARIPVALVPDERKVLLGLDTLDEPTRQAIQSAAGKKRTVQLTLGEIDRLARLASEQVKAVTDRTAKKRWTNIRLKLEEPLGRFFIDDMPDALERMAAGEDVPPALAMREMWGKLLERRKGK